MPFNNPPQQKIKTNNMTTLHLRTSIGRSPLRLALLLIPLALALAWFALSPTAQAQLPKSYYRLTTKWQGDGKSLDVVNDGMNNNQLILAKTGKFSGQSWKITPVGGGYYRLTTAWQGSGKSLDIVNDGKNNNQPILADTGNYSGQFWKIIKVK